MSSRESGHMLTGKSPNDDEPNSHRIAEGGTELLLIRVETQTGPNDILK
jgi:hypothetical protein